MPNLNPHCPLCSHNDFVIMTDAKAILRPYDYVGTEFTCDVFTNNDRGNHGCGVIFNMVSGEIKAVQKAAIRRDTWESFRAKIKEYNKLSSDKKE